MGMEQKGKTRPIIDGIMILPPLTKTPYLLGVKCSRCGKVFFPKKDICPDCFDNGLMEEIPLSPKGKLVTFTIIHRSLGNIKTPYAIGYIDTPEQIRLFSLLTESSLNELRIGMDMEVVFLEERGDEGKPVWVYKYRPVKEFP